MPNNDRNAGAAAVHRAAHLAAHLADAAEVERTTEALAHALDETAIARDQRGGHAHEERELIRDSGLLQLTIPREHGGLGHSYAPLRAAALRRASVLVRPAEVLADIAAQRIDESLAVGEALTAAERGEVPIAVAQAKAVAHRAAIEVSSQVFELTGAGSTTARLGLDRFWRNARVHTLHDPLDYKLRDLGRHALLGQHPAPTSYS